MSWASGPSRPGAPGRCRSRGPTRWWRSARRSPRTGTPWCAGAWRDPEDWGAAASGTGGGEDLLVVPEAINGNPTVFSLLPHAASLFLRGRDEAAPRRRAAEKRGVLRLESPYSQVVAGWTDGVVFQNESLAFRIDSPYAVVAVTAVGASPLKDARRLLVTAVARVQPTGFAWTDCWRHLVADPGRPPLLMEPVRARVLWKKRTNAKAYALDSSGKRDHAVELESTPDGALLKIDDSATNLHWELTAE